MSSKSTHKPDGHEGGEHGMVTVYIIGFALSLIFTAIPYYLVVSKTLTGTTLLTTILGFAFLQMAVQLFFFLHLGRGPKPLYNAGFFLGTFGAILVVVGGSVYIMAHLHDNMTPVAAAEKKLKLVEDEGIYQINGVSTGACHGVHTNHKVTIRDGVVTPGFIHAELCDTLTFYKEDDVTRELTFGTHPDHGSYAGETELTLRRDRGKMIVLGQPGTYQYHDHLNPATAGYFTVKP